jgi:signal transduction histidine kinase
MSLYQKGMLAFALVILIAVATVLLLVSRQAETGFRQYAILYSGGAQNSGRTQSIAANLRTYYQSHGGWDGVQAALETLIANPSGPQGAGPGDAQGQRRGGPPADHGNAAAWDFRVADAQGRVVAHTDGGSAAGGDATGGDATGALTNAERARALPLTVEGDVVGYLLPDVANVRTVALGGPEEHYLRQIRTALWTGAAVAFLAALLVGGLLMRGIVAPVRRLTRAAEQIAQGDLAARATPARDGRPGPNDEIGQLSRAFDTMAESLARSQSARRAQTADIAHELRNPLAVLQGTLEAVADGVYAPTPDNLDPALAQVQTLTRLVEDLRVLALADAGELRLERQRIAPGALLTRIAEAHRRPFAEHDIALTLALLDALPAIDGDPDRLTQVLDNLLANARHHVPAGGHVNVTAAAEGGGIAIAVIDDGPGVPADQLPHLFERFWRGDPSRSRDTGGSGLGLAIARRIIEAHGGHIAAAPTPGGGLTVTIALPAA